MGFYMPPRSHKDLAELDKTLPWITGRKTQCSTSIAGFNCPDVGWDTASVAHQVQSQLIDISTSAQLTQVHNQPTREEKPSISSSVQIHRLSKTLHPFLLCLTVRPW
eukprot:TRINITY_DN7938_c0_g1_i3.p1 TRINITY_DN7938_c0_g1~~TRINITY_DN7938_c0_g1_i3.p1  ORF type:complete len:107 (-),score=14.36 TRINITY_DN7938_c0_g1_i3:66-386(-)